jgi:hypothetical protein
MRALRVISVLIARRTRQITVFVAAGLANAMKDLLW